MAYRVDKFDNSIVIDGFQNGIGDSPHEGLANLQNVNIVAVPGEASVGFATSKISGTAFLNVSVTSVDATSDFITFTGANTVEDYQAVSFSSVSGPGGFVAGTAIYWLKKMTPFTGGTAQLYTDYARTSLVDITGSGTATFSTLNVDFSSNTTLIPNRFAQNPVNGNEFMVDSLGQVFSNKHTTNNGNWTHTGNQVDNTSSGNGIACLVPFSGASALNAYIFVFRNGQIDYAKDDTTLAWQYGWRPSTGTTGNTGYLNTPIGTSNSHEAMVAPDNRLYYCDANFIGRFYQTAPGTAFDPANTATYTADNTALLPATDKAQCITFLGTNLLVGGLFNVIYPWDRYSTNFNYPILISESNIQKMVTVNTNTFIFAGNRGRIFYTNGSQAQLYKKVPDHISNTVEPYFQWGGATSSKNQLYFSLKATDNAGNAINNYGGIWAIDLDTRAIRLSNQLSYGTYAGFAPTLFALTPIGSIGLGNPSGLGILAGWNSGASTYGIDGGSTSPYTNSMALIESDLIPIGTFEKPRTFGKIEYKLTKPMVAGESISIYTRTQFGTTYALVGTDSTVGNFSNIFDTNFANAQWLQLEAILNSTASSPSYVRLKELRIKGLT